MKKEVLRLSSSVVLLLSGGIATAADFDFVAAAAGNEGGASVLNFVSSSDATLTLEATGQFGGGDVFAYLDDLSGGNPGGLGVCQNLIGGGNNDCAPSSDDNVTSGETLTLEFNFEVDLSDIVFRDGGHNQNFADDAVFDLAVTDIFNSTTVFSNEQLVPLFLSGSSLKGYKFSFINTNNSDTDPYVFYIAELNAVSTGKTVIPVPAAVWLFGSALVGLIGVARTKRAV